MARTGTRPSANGRTETYQHPGADLAMRPEIGTQPQFRKRKPPATYRYDLSLSPSLEWDGKNPAREQGEWLLALIDEAAKLPAPQEFDQPRIFRRDDGTVIATCRGLRDAIDQIKRFGKPFLNWAGKAERLSFDVPTLPLFVHERLSTMAIVETLKDHTKEARDPQLGMFELFGDPQRPIADQVLKAYEYRDQVGQPDDPRRLACRDEFAAPLRRSRRSGADDLHRPALWSAVLVEFSTVYTQA